MKKIVYYLLGIVIALSAIVVLISYSPDRIGGSTEVTFARRAVSQTERIIMEFLNERYYANIVTEIAFSGTGMGRVGEFQDKEEIASFLELFNLTDKADINIDELVPVYDIWMKYADENTKNYEVCKGDEKAYVLDYSNEMTFEVDEEIVGILDERYYVDLTDEIIGGITEIAFSGFAMNRVEELHDKEDIVSFLSVFDYSHRVNIRTDELAPVYVITMKYEDENEKAYEVYQKDENVYILDHSNEMIYRANEEIVKFLDERFEV